MPALFAALATLYTTAASTAAALGMSRQAFSQASARRRLSERATLRAAALLGIDPAAALLTNATGKDIATPESNPAPDRTAQVADEKKPLKSKAQGGNNEPTTNYAWQCTQKKSSTLHSLKKTIHKLPQSAKRLFEIDCIKWMLCVPRLSPDSPRFAHYFSRWRVPEKIAASKQRRDFDEITKDCPLFAPELAQYIQAGIDEYHKFTNTRPEQAVLEDQPPQTVKLPANAFR